jgi:hypothetical protein
MIPEMGLNPGRSNARFRESGCQAQDTLLCFVREAHIMYSHSRGHR